MDLNPATREEALRLTQRCRDDAFFYYKNCLRIQEFGTGKLVPMGLNKVQLILHRIAERQKAEHNHIRIVVLKARRFGISTYVQGRFFHLAATRQNKVVQITTHSKAATNVMFNMARIMEQQLPEMVRPMKRYSGKRELVWGDEKGGLNSSYDL